MQDREYNNINIQDSTGHSTNKYQGSFYKVQNNVTPANKYVPINDRKTETRQVKTDAKQVASITSKIVAMVSAVMVGVVGADYILPDSSLQAEFSYVESYDTSVFYEVKFSEELTDKSELVVVLYNDFTNREQSVQETMEEEGMTFGHFENLKPNMSYSLEIRKGSYVLAKTKVRTMTEEEYNSKYGYEEPITEDDTGQQTPNTSDDPTTGRN